MRMLTYAMVTVWAALNVLTVLMSAANRVAIMLTLLAGLVALLVIGWAVLRKVDRPDPSQTEDYDLWHVPDKRDVPK